MCVFKRGCQTSGQRRLQPRQAPENCQTLAVWNSLQLSSLLPCLLILARADTLKLLFVPCAYFPLTFFTVTLHSSVPFCDLLRKSNTIKEKVRRKNEIEHNRRRYASPWWTANNSASCWLKDQCLKEPASVGPPTEKCSYIQPAVSSEGPRLFSIWPLFKRLERRSWITTS